MSIDNPARRAAMTAMATLPFAEAANADASARTGARTLVAYFSRSGNTRVIAGVIQRAQKADLFEIVPARAYPEEYFATVEQARQERDRGDQPALAGKVVDMARYDTVYLGFPIWGETVPPLIRSFLATHDLSGKVLIPFITHGGYGVGHSLGELASRAKDASVKKGLVMEADQERRTTTQVQDWLGTIGGAAR
jgi:flavodoxin